MLSSESVHGAFVNSFEMSTWHAQDFLQCHHPWWPYVICMSQLSARRLQTFVTRDVEYVMEKFSAYDVARIIDICATLEIFPPWHDAKKWVDPLVYYRTVFTDDAWHTPATGLIWESKEHAAAREASYATL